MPQTSNNPATNGVSPSINISNSSNASHSPSSSPAPLSLPAQASNTTHTTTTTAKSARQDPRVLIQVSYECLKKILELDAQSTSSDLNLIESLNTSIALRYKDLQPYLEDLTDNSIKIKESDLNLKKKIEDLNLLEKRVLNLKKLSVQLDEWSNELEVKTRRSRTYSSK
ncbi:hypothetical protein BVG19_g4821 [[Candida] boidinii]|nr:hypothetical protein BVG19_g4821 [[Candida] boidinii]OWB51664.1 hypothetical protein B5S27_g3229 [[Candida] boidinii]